MPVTLDLPSVLVTAGPEYATKVNAALNTLAAATHTGGANGDKWGAAALNIDGNVSWGGYSITSIKATTYTQQSSLATANSIYVKTDGTLHFVNGGGTDIQITSAGGLNTAALITAIWTYLSVATNYTILATDNYTYFKTDTSAARAFTLPAANGVTAGRFYVIVDATGSAATNNITINRAGSDTVNGGTSHVIDRNYGYAILVSDGTSAWNVASPLNATSSIAGLVKLAGDLGGSSASPTVVSLTGSGGIVGVNASTTQIQFNSLSACTITQTDAVSSAGAAMTIRAQAANGTNQDGGPLNIIAGGATGTGVPGAVKIQSSVSEQLRVGAFSGSRRFVAIGNSMPSSGDLPTGDGVIYIANASTNPSSNPAGGGVLYCSAGALVYRGTSGTVTTLALA